MLHTSGTTSRPKVVPLTNRNIYSSAINISNSLKLIILPVVVYFLASYYDLSQTEIVVAVIFASVPTAAMSYSLAQQFGADHQLMRAILTTQVALSFITIPLLLAFIA